MYLSEATSIRPSAVLAQSFHLLLPPFRVCSHLRLYVGQTFGRPSRIASPSQTLHYIPSPHPFFVSHSGFQRSSSVVSPVLQPRSQRSSPPGFAPVHAPRKKPCVRLSVRSLCSSLASLVPQSSVRSVRLSAPWSTSSSRALSAPPNPFLVFRPCRASSVRLCRSSSSLCRFSFGGALGLYWRRPLALRFA